MIRVVPDYYFNSSVLLSDCSEEQCYLITYVSDSVLTTIKQSGQALTGMYYFYAHNIIKLFCLSSLLPVRFAVANCTFYFSCNQNTDIWAKPI